MDIAPAKSISVCSVVILADLPHIPHRIPVQSISLYHSLFVVLLWCTGQHMDVQSFHLCPVQITVCLNTSIECYSRMWLSKQNSIKKKKYVSSFGEELCAKCLSFFLVIEFKISLNFELCLICKYLKFMFEDHILE